MRRESVDPGPVHVTSDLNTGRSVSTPGRCFPRVLPTLTVFSVSLLHSGVEDGGGRSDRLG